MRTRKRIHPYVTPTLAHRLTAYCAAKGITESAAVEAAVEGHLDGGDKDNEVIMRRLDRLGRASMRHQRDLDVMTESFAVFVRTWLAYLPELALADKQAAERLGQKRYQRFVEIVTGNLATTSRLVTDVVKDPPPGASGGTNAGAGPAPSPGGGSRDGQP